MPPKIIRAFAVAILGLFFGFMIASMILGWCYAMPGACG